MQYIMFLSTKDFSLYLKGAKRYEYGSEDEYVLISDRYVAKPIKSINELYYGAWLNKFNLAYIVKTIGIYTDESGLKYIVVERAIGQTFGWYSKKFYLIKKILLGQSREMLVNYEEQYSDYIDYLYDNKDKINLIRTALFVDFYQITYHMIHIIAELNSKYQFIHYDLHVGNMIINKLDKVRSLTYNCYGKNITIKSQFDIKLIDFGYSFCPDLLQLNFEQDIDRLFMGANIKVYDDMYDLSVFINKAYMMIETPIPKAIYNYLRDNGFYVSASARGIFDDEGINRNGKIDEWDIFGVEDEKQLPLKLGYIDNSYQYKLFYYIFDKLHYTKGDSKEIDIKYPLFFGINEDFINIKEDLDRDSQRPDFDNHLKADYIQRIGSYLTFNRLSQVQSRKGNGETLFNIIRSNLIDKLKF